MATETDLCHGSQNHDIEVFSSHTRTLFCFKGVNNPQAGGASQTWPIWCGRFCFHVMVSGGNILPKTWADLLESARCSLLDGQRGKLDQLQKSSRVPACPPGPGASSWSPTRVPVYEYQPLQDALSALEGCFSGCLIQPGQLKEEATLTMSLCGTQEGSHIFLLLVHRL